MADQIHALYLKEGWQKVESGLIVKEKCPKCGGHDPGNNCLCLLGTIIRPATGEEIAEIAELMVERYLNWNEDGQIILKSGGRVELKEKP